MRIALQSSASTRAPRMPAVVTIVRLPIFRKPFLLLGTVVTIVLDNHAHAGLGEQIFQVLLQFECQLEITSICRSQELLP